MNLHAGIYERTENFIKESGLSLLFSLLQEDPLMDENATIRIFSLSILEWGSNLFGTIWDAPSLSDPLDLGHPCSRLFRQEVYSFYYRGQSAPAIDWDNFHEIQDVYFNMGKYHLIMPISEWSNFLTHKGREVAYKTSKEVDKYKMMESLSE